MLNGLFLGIALTIGTAMTFVKLPRRLRHFFGKHELLTDFVFGAIIYGTVGLISKTVTGIIGAVVAEILLALGLAIYVRKQEACDNILDKPHRQEKK